jgi:hypothetical protein
MANPTTNYGWPMPTSTDLVTDLPADFAAFGQPVDTSLKALNPETTLGDISYRSATANTNTRLPIGTTGQVLAVSGGVPAWTTTADVTPLTTKGDLFTFDTADARLGVGTNGQTLVADSSTATGLKWATASSPSYAWTSYTPVVKGGATTVTKTVAYAKYLQIDKLVFVQVLVNVTSAGAVNGAITISLPSGLLPVTQGSRFTRGTFFLTDAGVGFYTGSAIITSDVVYGMSSSAGDFMGANTPAMTLANGDEISFQVVYEVA